MPFHETNKKRKKEKLMGTPLEAFHVLGAGLSYQRTRTAPDKESPSSPATRSAPPGRTRRKKIWRWSTVLVGVTQEKLEEKKKAASVAVIWNSDTHLSRWSQLHLYMHAYYQSSLLPVHPAIVDDHNLEQFLSGDSTYGCDPVPTALSFNIALGICLGAKVVGNRSVEEEFWPKAREQAGALFDTSDFHIASGLLKMCEYSFGSQQATYYATLGVEMLERLGRRHTAEYVMLLFTFKCIFDDANRVNPVSLSKAMSRVRSPLYNYSTDKGDDSDDSLRPRSSETAGFYDKIYRSDLRLAMAYLDGLIPVAEAMGQALQPDASQERLAELKGIVTPLMDRWKAMHGVYRPRQQIDMTRLLVTTLTVICFRLEKMDEALEHSLAYHALYDDRLAMFMPVQKEVECYPLQVLLQHGCMQELARLVEALSLRANGTFMDSPCLSRFTAVVRATRM